MNMVKIREKLNSNFNKNTKVVKNLVSSLKLKSGEKQDYFCRFLTFENMYLTI